MPSRSSKNNLKLEGDKALSPYEKSITAGGNALPIQVSTKQVNVDKLQVNTNMEVKGEVSGIKLGDNMDANGKKISDVTDITGSVIGITANCIPKIDETAEEDDFAFWTADGLKGLTVAETKTELALNNVTNNSCLPLAGGTMTGDIDFNDRRFLNCNRVGWSDGSFQFGFLDEDDMASNSASKGASQQSIKAYVDASGGGGGSTYRWNINAGFNYSSTAGTKVYAPLNGYIIESASSGSRNEYQVVVMPYDGYLEKVIVRSEEACASSIVGLHISGDNTETPNATASHTVTVNMAVDDVGYNFAFSDSASFSKGNAIAISFDPTNDANDTILTAVFVLDSST